MMTRVVKLIVFFVKIFLDLTQSALTKRGGGHNVMVRICVN